MNQLIHQEIDAANLHKFTSNFIPVLQNISLCFWPSWGYLIITLLIMVMLRFILQSINLNILLTWFQIRTPLQSNQLTMMKFTNSWNSSTWIMMMIFWVLISRFFRLEYWLPLNQNFIQSLLYCFINMEDQILVSQIACHNFPCLSQPRPI